jgi:hypothetical protein
VRNIDLYSQFLSYEARLENCNRDKIKQSGDFFQLVLNPGSVLRFWGAGAKFATWAPLKRCMCIVLFLYQSVDLVHTLVGTHPLNVVGSALRWRDLAGLC